MTWLAAANPARRIPGNAGFVKSEEQMDSRLRGNDRRCARHTLPAVAENHFAFVLLPRLRGGRRGTS